MGLIEKSSVTAYLEEYYEKHPLDNSYEGILARRSGLTKDVIQSAIKNIIPITSKTLTNFNILCSKIQHLN